MCKQSSQVKLKLNSSLWQIIAANSCFQLTNLSIDIPNDIEGKKIVKLTRQATNWGPTYLFHSCADVEFVKLSVSKY